MLTTKHACAAPLFIAPREARRPTLVPPKPAPAGRPIAIDLFCGLGGWTEGLLAEGYQVIGFDIEAHEYGDHKYPGQLVVQDVLTLHGSQFKDAALIVASPPCQEYSYMAMPWKKAKAKAAAIRADETGQKLADLNRLFDACFRIQKEASIAAGRHIPMVVENVRGAIPWVGRSRWNFGSFHLWGDVPALMPATFKAQKNPGFRFDGSGRSFQSESVSRHTKNNGGSWFNIGSPGQKELNRNPVHEAGRKAVRDGLGGYGGDFGWDGSPMRRGNSKSPARKFASAMIAKIPTPLARHIGATYRPQQESLPGGFLNISDTRTEDDDRFNFRINGRSRNERDAAAD